MQKLPILNWDKVVIIGSGPSLTQEQIDYCKGKANVIAVNDNYKLAPWADMLYACDLKWWDWYEQDTQDFEGIRATCDMAAAEKYDLNYIKGTYEDGLSDDTEVIHTNKNSGAQALNIAVHYGAKEIFLLGFDCKDKNGSNHWFGDHPDLTRPTYSYWLPNWELINDDCEMLGVKVWNCSDDSALTMFEQRPIEGVL